MTDKLELKPLSPESLGRAIEKAEHYRLLNDPEEAESICLDVLAIEPDNQRALLNLILSLTDQFAGHAAGSRVKQARTHVERLGNEYDRAYYSGMICEREARAYLRRGHSGAFAYECFHEAMKHYERAGALHAAGNEDAVLRWNSCARTIQRENLEPRHETPDTLLE